MSRPDDGSFDAPVTLRPTEGRRLGWLRRLGPVLREHRRRIVGAALLSVLVQLCIGTLPLVQKLVLDDAIVTPTLPLAPLLVLMVVLGALAFGLNVARRTLIARVCTDVQHRLRIGIHHRLHTLDRAAHDRLTAGDVMSRATTDLTLIDIYLNQVSLLVNNVSLLAIALVVMAMLSPLLCLVVAVFVPLFLALTIRYRDRVFPASWNDSCQSAAVAGVVDEAVSGVRVVKAFAQEERELHLLADRSRDLFRSRLRTSRITARYTAALQTLPSFAQLGVLAFGGWLALQGHLTLGVFLAFSSYLVQLVAPIRLLAALLTTSQQARAGAERIFELLELEPQVHDAPGAAVLADVVGAIELDHVTFAYGDGDPVLRDVSLRIEAGERVAIVGGSGSGKTTLVALLQRAYDPQAGTVRVDGIDLRDLTQRSLRRHVGMVFEEPFLFATTIAENIAFGAPGATRDEIEAVARAAHVHDVIAELPDGYDTQVGERGGSLSGGQRQRIALARVLLVQPRVLVLDEATSAVDSRTEAEIHAVLDEVLPGHTSILIANRAATLRRADRVVVLDQGRVIAEGHHDHLVATSARYRRLLTGPDRAETKVAASPALASIDPAAWPAVDRVEGDTRTASLASTVGLASLASGPPAGGVGIGAMAIPATPELLARVAALPPVTGEPDVDLDELTLTGDGRDRPFSFRRFARPFRIALIVALGLIVVDGATTLASPLVIGWGVDDGITAGDGRGLAVAVAVLLALQLTSWGNAVAMQRQVARTAERMLYSLRVRTFAQLQRLSLDFYDREMSGRIMTRMTSDVESLSLLLQQGLLTGAVSVLTCSGVLVVLLVLDTRLALAAFVVMPFVVATTVLFQRAATRAYLRAREQLSEVNADLQESLAGMAHTSAYVQERTVHRRFSGRSDDYGRSRFRSMQLQSAYFSTLQFLTALAKALTLWAGAHLIDDGTLSIGVLIAFLLYLDQFFSPMQQMSSTFDQWIQARVAMQRIDELLRIESGTPEHDRPVDPGRLRGELRFEGVRFAYAPGAPEALRGVDLHIAAGETVALVGTTGAGKSTFVKLAARFYDASGGRILVDGVPITDLDLRAFRRQLGYVPQEPFLFSGTVASTIAYGRPDATEAEIEAAARAVGVHPFVTSLPQGYRTPVTEGGRSLSAGQRQLLCLARARLVDPAVLILDEATSNLDPATEVQVQAAMAVVGAGRTTLLIAHRLSTARAAARIAVVEGGLVVEVGAHDELLARDGRYGELWRAHVAARPLAAGDLEAVT